MSHTWMKDINHKELMEVKGYSGLSRINLKKLLVERDEEIDTHIAETRTLEKQVKIAKIVNKKINREIKTMKKDWASATEHLGEQISNLTKEVNELKSEIRKRQTNGLACMNSWERKSKQQLQQIDNQCEELTAKDEIIKQQKQLINYYELREDYFEKFIEEWESGCHEWREFCEARAHKTGNEEHVGILFDEEEDEDEDCEIIEINVVGLGWCQYENEEDRDKQVVYCKNGCWKIKGDKTAKDEEGNYCETDEEDE